LQRPSVQRNASRDSGNIDSRNAAGAFEDHAEQRGHATIAVDRRAVRTTYVFQGAGQDEHRIRLKAGVDVLQAHDIPDEETGRQRDQYGNAISVATSRSSLRLILRVTDPEALRIIRSAGVRASALCCSPAIATAVTTVIIPAKTTTTELNLTTCPEMLVGANAPRTRKVQ
jgi:hypothetical protein